LSKSDAPFEPLVAQPVAPPAVSVETINWLERVAPRIPVPRKDPTSSVRPGETLAQGVRRAAFLTVDEIVAQEQERQNVLQLELPEVTRQRMEAMEEAKTLVGEAFVQAQAIEQEARERGFQAGYERGYAEGQNAAERRVLQQAADERAAYQEDLALFIAHIEAERKRAWAEIEPMVLTLVFALAKKVIKKEIEMSHDVAVAVIQNALRRVADSTSLRIRVHADDLSTVRANREELLRLVDGNRHIEIIEDRRVEAGGCIVETEAGKIDASIGTQLQEVAKLLEQA